MSMAGVAGIDTQNQSREPGPEAYAPSWIDRFSAWVDRLPGPTWVFYVALGLALGLSETVVQWHQGAYPVGVFRPLHVFYAAQIAYLLALMHYLDKWADKALHRFRRAMEVSDNEYAELQYRLTTLPARPALLASLAGAVVSVPVFILSASGPFGFAGSPVSVVVNAVTLVAVLWIAGALVYHTVRQLRLVRDIYSEHALVNVFDLAPLYAFSGLSARTAVGLTIWNYGWVATEPQLSEHTVSIVWGATFGVIAVATFAWPLLGIHQRIVEEKERVIREGSQRLEAVISELHRRVDDCELLSMDDMNKAIASLEIEQRILSAVPTWPWQPETVRLVATALLLPLILWISQFILQTTMGR